MTPDRKATPDTMGATRARTTTRLAVSLPAGLAVLLILGTVAFGHEGLFPLLPDPAAGIAPPAQTATPKPEAAPVTATPKPATATPKPKPAATPKPEEIAQAEATPKPAATPAPTPKPVAAAATPKPQPAPVPPTAALTLSVLPSERADKVQLGWTAYSGEGFEYYKLVRSRDANATWPASGDDEVIAAIGNVAETGTRDRPDCGATYFYRVFAVRHTDAGYQVLAPSNLVSASTVCPPPPPPPPATVGIGFEASFADGKVNLTWGACAVEGFNAWKIVRSQTNADPRYPDNGGAELIAAIGDAGQTWFSDASVASGQTWYYRVLARADQGGGNFIACETAVAAVTIP